MDGTCIEVHVILPPSQSAIPPSRLITRTHLASQEKEEKEQSSGGGGDCGESGGEAGGEERP